MVKFLYIFLNYYFLKKIILFFELSLITSYLVKCSPDFFQFLLLKITPVVPIFSVFWNY